MTRRLLAGAALVALAALPQPAAADVLPPVGHVFVIVLENESFDATWGPESKAPYLATTLRAEGTLLERYYGTGHFSLDNYITMISGQPPNVATQADCLTFTDFVGVVGSDGIAVGQGCVYPAGVHTLADQLEAAGLTWAGYMQDMGDDIARDGSATCAHPTPGLASDDPTQGADASDQYATRHNPFMYFHSIIDEPSCDANVVNLRRLAGDLASIETTPNFSFITPDLCNDGHDEPCITGEPGGLTQVNTFLQAVVPGILASPAFQKDGLLLITFDEAEAAGGTADATACCNEPTGPNTPSPGQTGPGGGRVGMLAISPFTTPGGTSVVPYNHYSFLRSMEDLFGLAHLGYAGADGLASFGADVFSVLGASATTTTTTAPVVAPTSTAPTASLPATGGGGWVIPAAAGAAALVAAAATRRLRPR